MGIPEIDGTAKRSKPQPELADRVRRIFTRARFWNVVTYFIVGLLLVVAISWGGFELEHHLNKIENWIERLGFWGLLAFAGLFVVATSLLVPGTMFSLIAGALFGMSWGIGVIISGSFLAAALQYTLARKLLRAPIGRVLSKRPFLSAIQEAVVRDEFRLQILLRLTPLNPATLSYLLGASGVRFWKFMVAFLAQAPALAMEVYAGFAGKQATRLAVSDSGSHILQNVALFGGLAACIAVMVIVSKMARKAVTKAVNAAGSEKAVAGKPL